MSAVMNMIVSMKELESEISTQDSQMSSLKVDASDLEAVKQVKGAYWLLMFIGLNWFWALVVRRHDGKCKKKVF